MHVSKPLPPFPAARALRAASALLLCAIPLLFAACSTHRVTRTSEGLHAGLPAIPGPAEVGGGQLVVVAGAGKGSTRARLYELERTNGGWRLHEGPLRAMVGRHGFAAPGEKFEGDGRTPSGLFPLELVFGYDADLASRMPYRQATTDDLWVDDAASPDYNTWVRRGETNARSYEVMRLPDRQYRHGIVIGYNRNPIVKGKGSAIFLHAWIEEGRPTAGCVSLDEEQLVRLIKWLDPGKNPMIFMGDEGDFPAITRYLGRTAP